MGRSSSPSISLQHLLIFACLLLHLSLIQVGCARTGDFCAPWVGRPHCGSATITKYDCLRAGCCWVTDATSGGDGGSRGDISITDNNDYNNNYNNNTTSAACYAGKLSASGQSSREWRRCASVLDGLTEGNTTKGVMAPCGTPATTPEQCLARECCWGVTRPNRLPSCYSVLDAEPSGTKNGDLRIQTNTLEIYYDSVWRAVCGANFREREARVACRQLGASESVRPSVRFSRLNTEPQMSWVNFVHCEGTESRLDQCSYRAWLQQCDNQFQLTCMTVGSSTDNQGDGRDLGLRLSDGDLRILGPTTANSISGRVEIYHNGLWGTICDDLLSSENSRNKSFDVICRQMGYLRGEYLAASSVADGTGMIWLDDVQCTENHKRLVDCERKPWGDENCGHGEDVGATCVGLISQPTSAPIRLVGGPLPTRGRLEVLYNNQWGTACNHGFTDVEASVACRQMKLEGGRVRKATSYGIGGGIIWLSGIRCQGDEWNLGTCEHQHWGNNECTHYDDVSIDCEWPTAPEPVLDACYGNVAEYQARTGVITTPNFPTAFQASTTCTWRITVAREKIVSMSITTATNRSAIWIFDGASSESEPLSISSGSQEMLSSTNVVLILLDASISDAAFQLTFNATHLPATQSLRLVDGGGHQEGRLEVRQWLYGTSLGCATVCEDAIDGAAARVICRQLGFFDGQIRSFGAGTGEILQHTFNCTGDELRLEDCPRQAGLPDTCVHNRDVGIACDLHDGLKHEDGDLRLSGVGAVGSGRLEIYHQQQWGTVCADRFTNIAATVACQQLGYRTGRRTGADPSASVPGQQVPQTIWLDEVRCHGDEYALSHCQHPGWGLHDCHHGKDVFLTCSGYDWNTTRDEPPAGCSLLADDCDWALRLQGGENATSGFVQVYHAGEWGAICTRGRNIHELAKRTCTQIGLTGGMGVQPDRLEDDTIRRIWLGGLDCTSDDDDDGEEEARDGATLKDCYHRGWGVDVDDCRAPDDLLAVECLNNTEEEYVCRLYSTNILNTFDDQYVRLEESGGYVLSRYEHASNKCSFTVEVIVDVIHTLGQQGPLRPSLVEIFFDSFHIKLRQDHRVMINSTEVNITQDRVYNVTDGEGFIIYTGDNHTTTHFESSKNSACFLIVGISQQGDVELELSSYYRGEVRGLCGNWDGLVNDLRTSGGEDVSHLQDRYRLITDSWMTNSIHSWD